MIKVSRLAIVYDSWVTLKQYNSDTSHEYWPTYLGLNIFQMHGYCIPYKINNSLACTIIICKDLITLANFNKYVGQWILSSSFAPCHKKMAVVVQCVVALFSQFETSVCSLNGFVRGISTTVILHLVDIL